MTQHEHIKNKLEKGKAFMKEMDVLLQNKFYNTVINRLYYACFHVTKALLMTQGLDAKTHSGVGIVLHKNFIKPGVLEMHHAAFFAKLMNERSESDYGDFLIIDETEVEEFLEPGKDYFQHVSKLVENYIAQKQ